MECSAALLVYSCLLLIPIALLLYAKTTRPSLRLPPGPRRLPIIGNLHQLGELPYRSLCLLSEKHGPLMSLKLGSTPTLIISSSDMACEILKTQDLIFCTRPPLVAHKRYSYGGLDMAFAPYGEQWRQVRRICMLEVFSAKRVLAFQSIREEEIETLIQTIIRNTSSSPVNLSEMLLCLFNNITSREVFNRRFSGDGECTRSNNHDLIREIMSIMGGFCLGDFFPSMEWLDVLTGLRGRIERSFHGLDELLEEEINKHINAKGNHDDFIDVLLGLQKDPSLGFILTRDQMKAIIMNVFLGGSDTSASTIEWAMSELMKNPKIMKKAQDEIRGLLGNKGKVEECGIQKLHYLKLVIKEVLRLHPPAPLLIPRECMHDCKINGYDIPKKTMVYINAWAIGRDPNNWQDAEAFVPERFEENDISYKGQHFDFIPFGSGRRICPGMSLGLVATEIALANLLYRFNWELPNGMSREDFGMEEHFGLVIHRRSPLLLVATPTSFAA
ncbi:cytochrome P450 71A1 [Elaeis guineensis]|uniref:Cytochrome P450 71A1 n=1 Tax=Elaeis guineensis var. tenera TaxID=51953 RepID=A0A6I9QIJ2_ELAGV|nr:cytochrome P450 71A1 [Elaeis guineensis]